MNVEANEWLRRSKVLQEATVSSIEQNIKRDTKRYHDHTRGSWTGGEVAGINGGTATFCIPAQQTILLLVRWMLVLEDSDEDRLYLGKGLPRDWVGSGKEIKIDQAPTRWGRVNFSLLSNLMRRELLQK